MNLPIYAKVDLTAGAVTPFPISEAYYQIYVGGKILGTRLLTDLTAPGLDPLAPESVLIVNTSPMTGTGAPSSSRFNLSFKNVLTGGIGSSNCGGAFGMMLKRAGFDGLILTGKSKTPCRIDIVDGEVALSDASDLWGLDAAETQARLPKHFGKLVIGPAGEHLVSYACAVSGERVAGRCGCGAVLGSKNIKAIIAYGTQKPEIADRPAFDAYVKKWVRFIRRHSMTGDSLPHYGSAGLVNKANASNALPTHNFQSGHFDGADAVSGEAMADRALLRNSGCISCPIRCERRVLLDGKDVKGPEYETCGLFGPNIGADDLAAILRLNDQCDRLGMDTISLAGTLAFAMELCERGMADFGVSFGDAAALSDVMEKIARREAPYGELGNGSKWLSEKYGGKDFAMHAKGLELASYEPRRSVGMGLGYATANRGGCHLGGGYLALLESVGVLSMDPQTARAKPEFTIFMQNALEAISACGFCLFTAQTMVPAFLYRLGPHHPITRIIGMLATHMGGGVRLLLQAAPLLRFNSVYLFPHAEAFRLATGMPMYTGSFLHLGERGFQLDRLYNLREGLTAADDSLPARLTDVAQSPKDPSTAVPLAKMLTRYYRIRGWDENGVPKEKTLRKLGLL